MMSTREYFEAKRYKESYRHGTCVDVDCGQLMELKDPNRAIRSIPTIEEMKYTSEAVELLRSLQPNRVITSYPRKLSIYFMRASDAVQFKLSIDSNK